MPSVSKNNSSRVNTSDWELDFYSRPIIESDGKKRWELLITTTIIIPMYAVITRLARKYL